MGMTALESAPLYGKDGAAIREMKSYQRQQDPSKLTRALGLSNIGSVNQIESINPISIVQPGITAPTFKID